MKRYRLLMFSLHPRIGFHHYSAELCNALTRHPHVGSIRYLIAIRDQRVYGVGSEEQEIVEPSVQIDYLAPAGLLGLVCKYWLFLRNLFRFLRLVWRGAFDVIHIQTATKHHFFSLPFLICIKASGVPIVRTVHEISMTSLARAGRKRWVDGLERWFSGVELKLADHLIVHDATMREQLKKRLSGKERAISVIPHGNYLWFRRYLPSSVEDGSASALFPCGEAGKHQGEVSTLGFKSPLVLFFGLLRRKGLDIFLQAWREVQVEGCNINALLVGQVLAEDGDLVEEARRLPAIEVYPGYIPNSDVWRCFCRSAFVAMPYLTGTTSGAVHLAYAFRRPVIVSDLDCFKDVVIPGKTGLVIPKGDPIALKEAMIQLANDPARCREMGEAAFRLELSSRYSWDTIASQTVEVYQRVCGGARV